MKWGENINFNDIKNLSIHKDPCLMSTWLWRKTHHKEIEKFLFSKFRSRLMMFHLEHMQRLSYVNIHFIDYLSINYLIGRAKVSSLEFLFTNCWQKSNIALLAKMHGRGGSREMKLKSTKTIMFQVSGCKDLTYLQHTYLSNIIPKSKLIELDAFLMKQLESNAENIILTFRKYHQDQFAWR